MRATADLVSIVGAGGLTVRLFSKNKGDTGNGTEVDASTSISLSSSGRSTAEWGPSTGTGIKQLVRYKFTASSVFGKESALFRMIYPLWFDAVNASTGVGPPP